MTSLREFESLKSKVEFQNEEINELKQSILDLKSLINEIVKKDKILINKSSTSEENNNDLSIIFTKYKQSLLVKNKYTDKNTTLKCKNELKELGAKWFKNETVQGWLFVGILKDSDKSLEQESQFIVNKLSKYNLDIEYV